MTIVLSNDDGIGAAGLEALRQAVDGLGETWIVAPESEFSGCGHQVTTHAPLAVRRAGDRRIAVAGTPADCARLAIRELCPAADLVLAGINAGGNLGVDVFTSGTVAAAREAAFLGLPAIAVSQYRRRDVPIDWQRATNWTRRVLEILLERVPAAESPPAVWNVNLPALPATAPEPEVVFCGLDSSPLEVRYRADDGDPDSAGVAAGGLTRYVYAGAYDRRPRQSGKDVDVCLGGRIAVTALRQD